jgi:hypothetical protein
MAGIKRSDEIGHDNQGASANADDAGVLRQHGEARGGEKTAGERGFWQQQTHQDVAVAEEIVQLLQSDVTGYIWNGLRAQRPTRERVAETLQHAERELAGIPQAHHADTCLRRGAGALKLVPAMVALRIQGTLEIAL